MTMMVIMSAGECQLVRVEYSPNDKDGSLTRTYVLLSKDDGSLIVHEVK